MTEEKGEGTRRTKEEGEGSREKGGGRRETGKGRREKGAGSRKSLLYKGQQQCFAAPIRG